jgi:peptidyl-prolyl cis-trans isomerase D
VAKSLGRDAVPYDNAPLTAVTDRRVGEAAFRMQPGQVSEPIQGELGWSVVTVTGVTPGVQPTLEQARPAIEAELRAETAEARVTELVEQYERAREDGANLAEAARRAGVPALTLAPVTQDGRQQNGQPLPLEPQLLAAAYELDAGEESEIQELGAGRYAAVRVDRRIAPALPALADIRVPLSQAWIQREVGRRLERRAQELAAAARKGGNLETAARGAGALFQRLPALTRSAAGSPIPPQMAGEFFGAKPGEIFTTATPAGYLVGRVDAVRFPAPLQLATGVDARRQPVTLNLVQELGEGARRAARRRIEPRTNAERAAAVLGVTPPAGEAQGGAARGGSGTGGGSGRPAQ